MEKLNLAGRMVGPGEAPYIIAEIGANHNGDMQLCKRLIAAAAESGADAVKFQSWSKSSLISSAEFARNTRYGDEKGETLEQMVERYQFTPEMHHQASAYCREKGITFLSSCFAPAEVDLLDALNVPAFKIASMDVDNLPLLNYAATKKRPVILSTGMATLGEIERAMTVLLKGGAGPVALLHCISIYPTPFDQVHLRNLELLRQTFDVPVGFSDHTLGVTVPLAAIALGACLIEKHFTVDKALAGWDHAISADPTEMRLISTEGRNVFTALGSATRVVSEADLVKRKAFRRRLIVNRPMRKGEVLQQTDCDFKRPGTGIRPDELDYVLGRTLTRNVDADHELEWSDLQ